MFRTKVLSTALAATAATVTLAAPAFAQDPEVVAHGLANPRGMAFGPHGDLFVAESGSGGDGACITTGEGGSTCYGPTGAITRVDLRHGSQERVVTGLPSLAPDTGPGAGTSATGPNDVSFDGRTGYFTVGLGANPEVRAQLGPEGRFFASLFKFGKWGYGKFSDIGLHEQHADPAKGNPSDEVDSNPFSVDATSGKILVTDAGGNDLLYINERGGARTVAVFPFGQAPAPEGIPGLPAGTPLPVQPVPTGITTTEDGRTVVGQLTGFPFPVGGASVFTVDRWHGAQPLKGGFTNIVDVAGGEDGSLYVLELTTNGLAGPQSPGKLVKLAPDGTETELAQLPFPTGLAVARDGDAYVAINGYSPTEGAVVRIPAA